MPFTIVASWDFRGADSAATKRQSRRGSYTLTEQGTPTYSTSGVTCDANGQALTLTLPAEMRYASAFWIMCGLRRIGTPTNNVNNFGFIHNDASSAPFHVLNAFYESTNGRVDTNASGTLVASTADAAQYPTLNTDQVWTLNRKTDVSGLWLSNTVVGSRSLTPGQWPTYDPTAHLALGCQLGVFRNPNTRYDWLLIGTDEIDATDIATIQAAPNTYIYGAATTPFRPYYAHV